jgi:polyferredoxin
MKRNYIQYLFLLFNIYIGIRFYLFVRHFETAGATRFISRPPSIEAYLPIASLIDLTHLVVNGTFDAVHPAGLVIFLAIIFSAVVLRRGFCSWICPIGTVSELIHKLGAKVAVNLKPRRFVDIPLRGLKYLVLGFFVFAIGSMDAFSLQSFIDSPFNKIADVRMLSFFRSPSTTTITVLAAFVLLSLVVKNFWCRYLCPYGALLGLLSKAGLVRVERDAGKCTDCRKCEKSCPAYINIAERENVTSAECLMCAECVNACGDTRALSIKTLIPGSEGLGKKWSGRLKPQSYGLALVGLFFAVILIAQVTGHWQTNISQAEYRQSIPAAAEPAYGHP